MSTNIRSFVVGTAGHIDHGKTELIKQITDANPDRLPEEQERDLTIDLGFAEYVMPDDSEVGIIDVPGHERFIRNMVAGATAMDFVILVVAADDGVMPQTREHLLIMDVLGIERGISVITKTDLVDEVLVEVVREELNELCEGTFMEEAPICPLSSKTGEGYDEFVETFEQYVNDTPPREPTGIFRMPVQRVFTVQGLGTIVTGVPVSGSIQQEASVEAQPAGETGRVRGIQAHHRDIQTARAGHRTALNLAELHHEDVDRGDVICTPGYLRPLTILSGVFSFQAEEQEPIEHWDPIRLLIGSDEVIGRIIPLEGPVIEPGEESLVQFQLEDPIAAVPGDPFVLRMQSPMTTLGGGTIVDVSDQRVTRSDHDEIESLKTKTRYTGDWKRMAQHHAKSSGMKPFSTEDIARASFVPVEEVEQWLENRGASDIGWLDVEEGKYINREQFEAACETVRDTVTSFHEKHPILIGIEKHDLQQSTGLSPEVLDVALDHLINEDEIQLHNEYVQRVDHDPTLPDSLQTAREQIIDALKKNPFQTPSGKELREEIPDSTVEDLDALLLHMKQKGEIIEPEESIYFHRSALEDARERVISKIEEQGHIETGEFRDMLGTSRKYAIPLLEYFDDIGLTYRKENKRYLT